MPRTRHPGRRSRSRAARRRQETAATRTRALYTQSLKKELRPRPPMPNPVCAANATSTAHVIAWLVRRSFRDCFGVVASIPSGSTGDGVAGRLGTDRPLGPIPLEPRPLRRSEEHTSELQSRLHLVCRLLLEKKKTKKRDRIV